MIVVMTEWLTVITSSCFKAYLTIYLRRQQLSIAEINALFCPLQLNHRLVEEQTNDF